MTKTQDSTPHPNLQRKSTTAWSPNTYPKAGAPAESITTCLNASLVSIRHSVISADVPFNYSPQEENLLQDICQHVPQAALRRSFELGIVIDT